MRPGARVMHALRRVRAMLAMRACRSSIMIGKPLDKLRMQRVLQHLSELDSPWNCPHGRCAFAQICCLSVAVPSLSSRGNNSAWTGDAGQRCGT